MKKKLLFGIIVLIGIFAITGCGGIKEKDFVGTKWIDLSFNKENGWDSSDEYENVIHFKEASIMTKCDVTGKYCTTYTWKIKGKYIEYYYNDSNPVDKFKISDDNKSLIRIGEERTYTKSQ